MSFVKLRLVSSRPIGEGTVARHNFFRLASRPLPMMAGNWHGRLRLLVLKTRPNGVVEFRARRTWRLLSPEQGPLSLARRFRHSENGLRIELRLCLLAQTSQAPSGKTCSATFEC